MWRKVAVFEEVANETLAIVNRYLENDFRIYFFKIEDRCKREQWVEKHLERGRLKDISEIVFEYLLYIQAGFYAYENVDLLFNKYFLNSKLINNMKRLLEFPEIENMYKKQLLLELEKIYIIELKVNEIVKNVEGVDEIYFFPSNNFEIHSDELSLLLKQVKVVNYKNIRIDIKNIINKLEEIEGLFNAVDILFNRIKKISKKKDEKEKFKVGVRLHLPGIFSYFYSYIHYIIEDYGLPKDEVLFLDETGSYKMECRKRGYNYVDIAGMREVISANLFWNKFVCTFFPIWMKSLLLSFLEERFTISVTRQIMEDYIIWNIFADSYSIRNYVNILNPEDMSKNRILSQNNIKTWLVYPDSGAHYENIGWDENIKTDTHFGITFYDYVVVEGDRIKRFFQTHRNFVKEYIKNGVLSSQTTKDIESGRLPSSLPEIIRKKNLPKTIIAVFDTSFWENGFLKIKDGVSFLNTILRLLAEMPDIGIIFKRKKFRAYAPALNPLYDKLRDHKRCILIDREDNSQTLFTPHVIAESDLVVCVSPSSPLIEALSAKKKAMYYDVTGKHIGDNYYYNKFPNLVAHSYEELKRLINYWLYEITDQEFDDFLNKYVKDELDAYLDGKAISRLQKMLAE